MVSVIRRDRKPPILTPSSLPCLAGLPTLNLTQGCAHGCTYCYIQGYSNYPGEDRVLLFQNTPELMRMELSRKRRRPRRVYFSPSSDAFQYLPEVQEVAHQTMSVLLQAGIEVAFLTKGFITPRFLDLFAKTPALVHAQIGVTTLDTRLCKAFEPRAAPPAQRIQEIVDLRRIGVATTARLDPLIPDLTDTPQNLERLLSSLRQAGVGTVAASYLFLRPAFAQRMLDQMQRHRLLAAAVREWPWRTFADDCGGGRMPDGQERRQRFSRLIELAARHQIEVHICACKNPDLGGPGCQIAGTHAPADRTYDEPSLFA
jgi:DNA repair photolyase